MPAFKPNMLISDCWSSIGRITFYHRNGKCYYRSKPYSHYSGTASQLEYLAIHRRAIRAWQSLSHACQSEWKFHAKSVTPHQPPFDGTTHISGYNLFTSAYHGFAQLGNERIPEPRPFTPFPIFSLDFVSCKSGKTFKIDLSFRLTIYGTSDYSRYRVLGKIQLSEPGTGINPGMMRNNLSASIPEAFSTIIHFIIPNNNGKANPPGMTYQIHLEYLLLDTVTGYRSQSQRLSTLLPDTSMD